MAENTRTPNKQPAVRRRASLRGTGLLSALSLATLPAHAVAADAGTVAILSPFSVVGAALIVGGAAALVAPALLNRGDSAKTTTETADEKATAKVAESAMEDATPTADAKDDQAAADTLSYQGDTLKTSGRRILKDSTPAAGAAESDGKLEPGKIIERESAEDISAIAAYNTSGAARYVGGLTDQVLKRAQVFFSALATQGEIDSAELARRLDAQPTELAGLLLTSLTRRAEAVTAPSPFNIGRVKGTRRRLWLDKDGISRNLVYAADRELAKRNGGTSGRNGFRDAPEVKAIADAS